MRRIRKTFNSLGQWNCSLHQPLPPHHPVSPCVSLQYPTFPVCLSASLLHLLKSSVVLWSLPFNFPGLSMPPRLFSCPPGPSIISVGFPGPLAPLCVSFHLLESPWSSLCIIDLSITFWRLRDCGGPVGLTGRLMPRFHSSLHSDALALLNNGTINGDKRS